MQKKVLIFFINLTHCGSRYQGQLAGLETSCFVGCFVSVITFFLMAVDQGFSKMGNFGYQEVIFDIKDNLLDLRHPT